MMEQPCITLDDLDICILILILKIFQHPSLGTTQDKYLGFQSINLAISVEDIKP